MYKVGQIAALQELGLVKTARRRIDEPNYDHYGNAGIPLPARQRKLDSEALEIAGRNLPPEEQYASESASAGRTGGGVLGGLLGGVGGLSLATSPGSLKNKLMLAGTGAALGGATGLGFGHFLGKAKGQFDSQIDKSIQGDMQNYLAYPPEGREDYLYGMQSQLEKERLEEAADLQRELARTPRVNYNVNSDPYPYPYHY